MFTTHKSKPNATGPQLNRAPTQLNEFWISKNVFETMQGTLFRQLLLII